MELKKLEEKNACFLYTKAGSGPPLHFAHANGFPPGIYEHIFQPIGQKFSILSLNFCLQAHCFSKCDKNRPLIRSWYQLTEELISFLESMSSGPVVGVGHSMGGVVTMLASIKRPELFTTIILLDPVFIDPKLLRLLRIITFFGIRHKHPLAERARKRINKWESREEALNYLRDKPLFSGWEEKAINSYIEHGLADTPDGVELVCSPEAEATGFETYPPDIWRWIKLIDKPATIVRGSNSDVLVDNSWSLLARLKPDVKLIQLDNLGHLFPMQDSSKTAQIILDSTGWDLS